MNNNKKCELCCKKRGRIYCESDEAILCFDCDWRVHSANFLVAKHSRNLLCNSCQNLTPWSASGSKVSLTLSICNSCLENPTEIVGSRERVEENYQTETDEENEYDNSTDDDDDDDGEEGDGNQVVPLSSSSSSSPSSTFSPVSSSGSYGDLSAAGDGGGSATTVAGGCCSSPWKRLRENDCLHSENEETCSSSLICWKRTRENIIIDRVLETNEGASNK